MIAPRRFLPSVSCLLAFEAAARLGSATAAAAELSLTQSAISRHIKTLETQLGIALMQRDGRMLRLTPTGETYALKIRSVLNQLASASIEAGANPKGGSLNLAILPAFGMHWLAPRLSDFARTHPEVTINLSTRLAPFDFRSSRFDAAIHFGRQDWPNACYMELMPEIVIAVCAPSLLKEPLDNPETITAYPLLHLETRAKGWSRWLEACGLSQPQPTGMVFDQFSTMAQAAVHGLGIALLPTFVAEPYLKNKQLVRASTKTSESIGSYYLVWPAERANTAAMEAFRSWLATQIQSPS